MGFFFISSVIICSRDVGVCKIFQLGTGGEWLGCDACGQFFHAACINVDYYLALAEPTFLCPQ